MDNKNNTLSLTSTSYKNSMLITYDPYNKRFIYSDEIRKYFNAKFDSRPIWEIFESENICSSSVADEMKSIIDDMTMEPSVFFKEYCLTSLHGKNWFLIGFINNSDVVTITITDINKEKLHNACNKSHDYDDLTGLLTKNAFCDRVQSLISNKTNLNEYAVIYFDVVRFKAINDIFGNQEGDRVLIYIADTINQLSADVYATCRIGSDRFAIFTHTSGHELDLMVKQLIDVIKEYDLPFEVNCNVGIYVLGNEDITVDLMIDRAILAQSSIKGSYTLKYNYYTEALRYDMLSEQEIVGIMNTALEQKHFVVYYQPQYNHSTGMIIGAEALVRWRHPDRGLISPGVFIPIFEKNGFITKLDFYVFEQVCVFLRKCLDNKLPIVPVSTNFSRNDIYYPGFADELEKIRKKYNIASEYLRVEITESALVGNVNFVNEVIKKLHSYGYIIEMDDFGSGYSSLNVLKDVEFDIIKLDMLFLAQQSDNNRGGTILSSVVRMAKWLKIPVIAEGVEKINQADFLKSIGCDYIQGYLYSRPLPENDYEKLLSGSLVGAKIPQMKLIDTFNAGEFWNPTSQETLIFNNYVGGAAIFSYSDGELEVLRVNKKYLTELGMNLSEKEIIECNMFDLFDEDNKQKYINTLNKAIESMDEEECETWRSLSSECCGSDYMCIRSNVRVIGKSEDSYLFYAMIRNVTAEKHHYSDMIDNEKRFKMASEQANVYFWEYTIATHEMRPCFRCMRDLGFPPVLKNYPDSAIEAGVFPPEVADMYRDWHVQISKGVKELEAVIPLTENRVPFRVKYTTEFDSNGRPVKAYGSATLIVND